MRKRTSTNSEKCENENKNIGKQSKVSRIGDPWGLGYKSRRPASLAPQLSYGPATRAATSGNGNWNCGLEFGETITGIATRTRWRHW